MNAYGYRPQAELLGIPDRFIGQGTQEQLRRICGFDLEGIYRNNYEKQKIRAYGVQFRGNRTEVAETLDRT